MDLIKAEVIHFVAIDGQDLVPELYTALSVGGLENMIHMYASA